LRCKFSLPSVVCSISFALKREVPFFTVLYDDNAALAVVAVAVVAVAAVGVRETGL
jgi:hypothetical protein